MGEYLLDTDICVFFLKGQNDIKNKIEEVGISNCFISEVTIAELTYGAYKSRDFEKHIKEVAQIEELFVVLPIYNAIPVFAKEKVRLQQTGTLIPDFDLLIGTTSLVNECYMVSNNHKHLSRIAGIHLVNWVK